MKQYNFLSFSSFLGRIWDLPFFFLSMLVLPAQEDPSAPRVNVRQITALAESNGYFALWKAPLLDPLIFHCGKFSLSPQQWVTTLREKGRR